MVAFCHVWCRFSSFCCVCSVSSSVVAVSTSFLCISPSPHFSLALRLSKIKFKGVNFHIRQPSGFAVPFTVTLAVSSLSYLISSLVTTVSNMNLLIEEDVVLSYKI